MKASLSLFFGHVELCHSMVTVGGVTLWMHFSATQTWAFLYLPHSLLPFMAVEEAEGGKNKLGSRCT